MRAELKEDSGGICPYRKPHAADFLRERLGQANLAMLSQFNEAQVMAKAFSVIQASIGRATNVPARYVIADLGRRAAMSRVYSYEKIEGETGDAPREKACDPLRSSLRTRHWSRPIPQRDSCLELQGVIAARAGAL